MLRAIWSVPKIQISADTANLKASVGHQNVKAFSFLVSKKSIYDFKDIAQVSDATTIAMSILANDLFAMTETSAIQTQMPMSEFVTVQDSLVIESAKPVSEQFIVSGAASVLSATSSSLGEDVGVTDICLTFIYAGLGGGKFNEAQLNGCTFNE